MLADRSARPPRNSYFPTTGRGGILQGFLAVGLQLLCAWPSWVVASSAMLRCLVPGRAASLGLAGLGIFGRRMRDQDSLLLCLAQAASANVWVGRWSPLPGGSFGECVLLLFLMQARKFNSATWIRKLK